MLLYKNGGSDAAVTNRLLLRRKRTLVYIYYIFIFIYIYIYKCSLIYIYHWRPTFKRIWINRSRHIIITTDGEEETGKSWMGRNCWVTDICCNQDELWSMFSIEPSALLLCSAQLVFGITCIILLVRQEIFLIRNKHSYFGAFWWLGHVEREPDL